MAAAFLVSILAIPGLALAQSDATEGLLVRVNGDVTVPANQNTSTVVVISGDLVMEGNAETVVVVQGHAVISGATIETLVVVSGSVSLTNGAFIDGDVYAPNSTVTDDGSVTISGEVVTEFSDFAIAWLFFGFIFAIGFGIATILSALLFAAIAPGTARRATGAIKSDLGGVALAGVFLWIVLPLVATLLMLTVVGIPSALFVFFLLLPAFAFAGYLVAGIYVGNLLVDRDQEKAHPYLAAFVGTLILMLVNFIPFLGGLMGAVAVLAGGASLALLAWRGFRSDSAIANTHAVEAAD